MATRNVTFLQRHEFIIYHYREDNGSASSNGIDLSLDYSAEFESPSRSRTSSPTSSLMDDSASFSPSSFMSRSLSPASLNDSRSSLSSLSFSDEIKSPPSSPSNDERKEQAVPDEVGFTTPPPSPRRFSAPVAKVTPEKMKDYCLKASNKPPQPALFQDDDPIEEKQPLHSSWALSPWKHAHQENVRAAIDEVIETVQYISHQTFVDRLGQSVAQVNLHLTRLYGATYTPGMRCIVLTQEGKSNLWVAELARQHFDFNAERYMDLGLNDADQFTRMLQGIPKRDMNNVREKFHGRTIVLFDDASYSGKQMSSHLFEVRKAVHAYKLAVRQIVVIVPFSTPFSQVEIAKASAVRVGKVALPSITYISPSVDLAMLSDLSLNNYDLIVDLWYKGKKNDADRIGLAYFEHKIPNDQSFPVALAKGSIYHLRGTTSQSQKDSFPILPMVTPDYKGTTAERFSLRARASSNKA